MRKERAVRKERAARKKEVVRKENIIPRPAMIFLRRRQLVAAQGGGGADLCDSFRFFGGDTAYDLTKILFYVSKYSMYSLSHCIYFSK